MSKKGETTEPVPDSPQVPRPAPAIATVSGLMEERRRFEAWLASLEARREATPERVFARVHADYTTRLEAVVSQLRNHTEGLRAELVSLAGQLASAQEEQQHAREERAEAELRAHVGELSAADWETTARTADERIAALGARHKELESELRRTREMLADAERPATPHLASAAIPAAAVRDAAVEATVSASVNAAVTPEPGSVAAVSDVAEGAAHVPGPSAPAASPSPAKPSDAEVPTEIPPSVIAAEAELMDTEVPPAPAGGAAARRPTSGFDELAFLNSVVDTPQKAPARPQPAERIVPPAPRPDSAGQRAKDSGIVNLDSTADTSILGPRSAGKKGTPLGANVSGNHPIVINEKSGETTKTLKCADCGAMNFPTEWYCERCGAELASL